MIIEIDDSEVPVLVEAIQSKYAEYGRDVRAAAGRGEWAAEPMRAMDELANICDALEVEVD